MSNHTLEDFKELPLLHETNRMNLSYSDGFPRYFEVMDHSIERVSVPNTHHWFYKESFKEQFEFLNKYSKPSPLTSLAYAMIEFNVFPLRYLPAKIL